ncbi:acyl-CoA synthetase [Zavarzinia sp. CC-PAN008]|uniref:acyl-CoA synthetase n=1 Tax=Zavarzinia sp. CC-PAN008 TaxID=3243332 RepID=UPI003F749F7A
MTSMHFATLWEAIADAVPDAPALIHGDRVVSWREYETRSARLAQALGGLGVGADSKVALYLTNSPEYMEAQFAAMKLRGVPINVNWRYREDELIYLLDNADADTVVFEAEFADRIEAIRDRLPGLRNLVQVGGNGAPAPGVRLYEGLIAQSRPAPRIERAEDDLYMLYTGGTTGMPKGVMYTHGGHCGGLLAGYEFRGLPRPLTVADAAAAAADLVAKGMAPRSVVACPLMHGTGMWLGAMIPHAMGGAAITLTSTHFDADELWQLVERHKATDIAIVGDAFAKPMLAALDRAKAAGRPYDISSMQVIISSGVMFTTEVKLGLLAHHAFTLIDGMGSTEGGIGMAFATREAPPVATAKFVPNPTTKVITEDGRQVAPGSGEIGRIAAGGNVPLGYWKDPKKSAETFKVIDGERYALAGDFATVEADGTITLLGRGSVCINTGGEKVFPEEVEEAVKTHPAVWDCLVVGVPDERFGERVTAVAALRPGSSADEQAVMDWVRTRLAGYKAPRNVVLVDEVQRAPNGKADYKWAKSAAKEALGIA